MVLDLLAAVAHGHGSVVWTVERCVLLRVCLLGGWWAVPPFRAQNKFRQILKPYLQISMIRMYCRLQVRRTSNTLRVWTLSFVYAFKGAGVFRCQMVNGTVQYCMQLSTTGMIQLLAAKNNFTLLQPCQLDKRGSYSNDLARLEIYSTHCLGLGGCSW